MTEIPHQGPTKGVAVRVSVYLVSDSDGMLKVCHDEHLRHVKMSGTMCKKGLIYLQMWAETET